MLFNLTKKAPEVIKQPLQSESCNAMNNFHEMVKPIKKWQAHAWTIFHGKIIGSPYERNRTNCKSHYIKL